MTGRYLYCFDHTIERCGNDDTFPFMQAHERFKMGNMADLRTSSDIHHDFSRWIFQRIGNVDSVYLALREFFCYSRAYAAIPDYIYRWREKFILGKCKGQSMTALAVSEKIIIDRICRYFLTIRNSKNRTYLTSRAIRGVIPAVDVA